MAWATGLDEATKAILSPFTTASLYVGDATPWPCASVAGCGGKVTRAS